MSSTKAPAVPGRDSVERLVHTDPAIHSVSEEGEDDLLEPQVPFLFCFNILSLPSRFFFALIFHSSNKTNKHFLP